MTKKKIDCRVCSENHEIDKYGWVQSCIGYFESGNLEYEITKYLKR